MKVIRNGVEVSFDELKSDRKHAKRFREELRSGQCPGIACEDRMLAQFKTLDQQIKCPITRKAVIRNARQYGYNPKPTDVYMPTLVPPGHKPGHPDAWLSHTEGGRSKIKRVLESRGVESGGDGVDGWVKTKGRDLPPPKPVKLAKDIQEQIYRERVAVDPGVARKDKREVLESIVEDHAAKD